MTDTNQVEATEAATETVENQASAEETVKTFSQDQLDKIVEDRLKLNNWRLRKPAVNLRKFSKKL